MKLTDHLENADTFFPKFEIFGHSEINEEGKAVTIVSTKYLVNWLVLENCLLLLHV